MHTSKKDYNKLYLLQNKFLNWLHIFNLPFYLTGGTALGRFYLNHRYSDDLDFFVNADPRYLSYVSKIKNSIVKGFDVDIQTALFNDDFTRIFINENDVYLKIEFVNDIEFRVGNPFKTSCCLVDTIENILSNKLTAVIGRDEPKDVCDIIFIAKNYSFNWQLVFQNAKQKSVINEIDIEKRLHDFPVELLETVIWKEKKPDLALLKNILSQITDDFLFGKINSVCQTNIPLNKAKIKPFDQTF